MDDSTIQDAHPATALPERPAGAGGASSSPGAGARVRSCALCHRRKVRCDKKFPCSTCTRTGVLCCYPVGSRSGPRKEKATISDIATRIAQLERTLVAISTDVVVTKTESGGSPKLETISQVREPTGEQDDVPHPLSERTPSGMLLHHAEGDSSHYVNEVIFSRVLEEEREIQSILGTPRPHETDTPGADSSDTPPPLAFGLLGLITHQSPGGTIERGRGHFHPHKWQAIRLWQVYLQNVDALGKFLHVPSVEVLVYSAIDDPDKVDPDVKCLMFAIYFAATTSLAPDEVFSLLSQDKTGSLRQFRAGLEASLAACRILERPTVTSLQALGLYLQNARAHNTGRSVWVINGIAMRLAQSLGLHRDPSRFGLPPFEAEIRRRLWWHIAGHDARASEDHGLAVSTLDPTTDTRIPLAVDDSALHPDMTELPTPPVGRFTEMTMMSLIYEINRTNQRLYRMLPTSGFRDPDAPAVEAERQEIMGKLNTLVEQRLASCNPVIPVQRAVSLIIRAVTKKTDFVSRQQWLHLGGAKDQPPEARASEESLADACEILELNLELQSDELLRNYRWTGEIYPQYQIILYVLWYLTIKPSGPMTERAWKLIDGIFGLEASRRQRQELSAGASALGAKWPVIEAMREKALRIRSAAEVGVPPPANAEAVGVPNLDVDMDDFGSMPSFDERIGGIGWETGFWDSLVDGVNANHFEASGPA